MTCKECKFGIKKKDCFTGAYYYECSNEIDPIPFNTTNDFVIADSRIVVNCNAGEEKPLTGIAHPVSGIQIRAIENQ